jgi:hypothetical protein
MSKKQHIQKLSYIVKASGLGVFLTVGFNGCDVDDDCNKTWNNSNTPINQTDECKESRRHGGGTTIIPTSSGYFGSSSSSSHESVGA